MRVLITGRGQDSRGDFAVGIFELDQARALRAAGHDVRFAAIDTRSVRRARPWGCRETERDGLRLFYCAIPSGKRPYKLAYRAQQWAGRLLWRRLTADGWRPDVVHAQFGTGLLPLAQALAIPTVYTEHSSQSSQEIPDRGELEREEEAYRCADALVCVSRRQAALVERNTGRTVRVIPNVVEGETFFPAAGPREPGERFRFVSVGNLNPDKGFDLLLTALAALTARGTEAALAVVGDGPEAPSLHRQAEALGLAERVRFTGRLERGEIAALFARSDAFVLPSRSETFGVAYVEAMAAGLPVIASACGGPEDYVNQENGLLVPVGDTAALTKAMERMAHRERAYDPAAISAFARAGFSPAVIAGQLQELYEEIVS